MKARKRFLLLFIAFLTLIHFGFYFRKNRKTFNFSKNISKNENNFYFEKTFEQKFEKKIAKKSENKCRMNSCFDWNRCRDSAKTGLKIHLYSGISSGQNSGQNLPKLSQSFGKIVEIIRNSVFFEKNPKKACLFMSTFWDSLDRDPLSHEFQKSANGMTSFSPLYSGLNHIVFNLYSGSWPHYRELDFSIPSALNNNRHFEQMLSNAILIKASQSRDSYRPNFDVSLPLFARNHPTRGPTFVSHESQQNYFPTLSKTHFGAKSVDFLDKQLLSREKYLLVFKGKRYIYGIGSETRNSLHYLNNGRDVLILTTCRHGKKWKEMKDEKCESDNQLYDKHDYQQLMSNSTFCLVPRGRRLGSYRFLEALSVGCIPVVLSNSWVLPFQEIIDWNSCAVTADERLLLQIPEQLRSISGQKIETMRHKCLALYETYFSSVEKIVLTSLLIIEERIHSHLARQHFVWNLVNPSMSSVISQSQLGITPHYSQLLLDESTCPSHHNNGFTAVIHVKKDMDLNPNLQKLIQRCLHLCPNLRQIIVLWSISAAIPHYLIRSNHIRMIRAINGSNSDKFSISLETIETDAVFQLSPNSLLSAEEIEFSFSVWKSFPKRLIGFNSRDHYFDEDKHVFQYSSKWTNQYSLLLSDSIIYHKLFNHLFTNFYLNNKRENALFGDNNWLNDYDDECADLAFAFLVSHITREGPLKVSQRKKTITLGSNSWLEWSSRRLCFSRLQQIFGYLPLIQSNVRLDPLLYKDLVSIRRKKYRKMETN